MKKIFLSFAAAAVIAMVAAPAIAATQWNFGASLRYMTFWEQANFGKERGRDLEGGGYNQLKNDGNLRWGTAGNSRIKMFMKSDSLEGFIEMGWNEAGNSVTTREYWGKYKFNDMAFIQIGQSHQLFNTPGFSNQVWGGNDIGMHGIGTSFNPPTSKIILGYGGFSFALATPYKGDSELPGGYNVDVDTYIPQLQASYQYRADTWRIKLAGAYQHYSVKSIYNVTTAANPIATKQMSNKNVNSWLIALDGDINFGPLYLKGTASVGQNWANAQWNSTRGGLSGDYTQNKRMNDFGYEVDGNKIRNTTSWMAAIVAGYRLTEDLKFEGGFGYRYDDNKMWKNNSNMFNAYIQAAYTVAPGFTITPEVGYIDFGKTVGYKPNKGVDAGYLWYAGAKWQMDF